MSVGEGNEEVAMMASGTQEKDSLHSGECSRDDTVVK